MMEGMLSSFLLAAEGGDSQSVMDFGSLCRWREICKAGWKEAEVKQATTLIWSIRWLGIIYGQDRAD